MKIVFLRIIFRLKVLGIAVWALSIQGCEKDQLDVRAEAECRERMNRVLSKFRGLVAVEGRDFLSKDSYSIQQSVFSEIRSPWIEKLGADEVMAAIDPWGKSMRMGVNKDENYYSVFIWSSGADKRFSALDQVSDDDVLLVREFVVPVD